MNRRTFVVSALAAGRAFSANDRVQLGMIGVGGRGRALTSLCLKDKGTSVAWLCDVDQANLERAAKLVRDAGQSEPKTGADLRKMLDDPAVDAVVIATPDHWHAPATLLAIEAGKDVYVEKPASHNLREGRWMVEAARRNNRVVQLGTQARSRSSTLRAIDYVHSGKIGRVLSAKAWNVQLRENIGRKPDGPVPPGVDYDTWVGAAQWLPFNANRFHYNWHWHWNFGTGDMGNDGAHQIDIARWALGVEKPLKAGGLASKLFFDDDQQTPDTMSIAFDYGSKMLFWEMRIWNPYGMEEVDNGVAVHGTDGMVHIGRWNRVWGFKVFDKSGKLVLHDKQDPGGDDAHMANFADCVRSRKRPNADIETGHLSSLHCHLGNIVARTGRTLSFDPQTETIAADQEASALLGRNYRKHWSTPKRAL